MNAAASQEAEISNNLHFGNQAAMNSKEKTILLVESKELFMNVAQSSIELLADHFNIIAAGNGETAQEVLKTSHVDLIITALQLPGMTGFQLIEHINSLPKPVPFIVWTTHSEADVQRKLQQLGAQHVLTHKPQDLNDLEDTILKVLSEDQEALLKGMTLIDYIKKIKLKGNSCTLTVQSRNQTGYLYIANGLLVNAKTDINEGDQAARLIFGWKDPEIISKVDSCLNDDNKISELVLSEVLNGQKSAPPRKTRFQPVHPLAEAIQLIKSQNLSKGSKLLTNYLKSDHQNATAWFWLSRCSLDLIKIEECLGEAQRLAPNNSAIEQDLTKLQLAKENAGDNKIRRCPFCWAPISAQSIQCNYCRSIMFFNEKLTSPVDGCNVEIINNAINDFNSVPQKENNPNLLYFLSLAAIHVGKKSDALFILRRANKIAPKVKFLSSQLHILEKLLMSTPSYTADKMFQKKILVVEDSGTTRKFIVKTLNKNGFQTIEAEDGLEALSKLNSESPDLILLDIILPKMDGYKVLSIIKESGNTYAKTPVIMLTSKDGMLNKIKGKMAGSSAYLTKPFKPEELIKTIEKNL